MKKWMIAYMVGSILLVVGLCGWYGTEVRKLSESQPDPKVYVYAQSTVEMQLDGMGIPLGSHIVGFSCLPHGEDVECYTAFMK